MSHNGFDTARATTNGATGAAANGTNGAGSAAVNGTAVSNGNGRYAATGEVPDDIVRVLRGAPDEDELAALVAGIVAARAAGSGNTGDDGSRTSLWTNYGHQLGLPPSAARAAWRWSARADY